MNDKKWELSLLCDIYGALLSEKQRTALEMYCNEDYSLSEIAENTGISRQGVRDQIEHARTQLVQAEAALGLLAKYTRLSELLGKLEAAKAVQTDSVLAAAVKEIRETLNF